MAIVLNPDMEQRITRLVESGQYHSVDEVVEMGLELLEARDSVEARHSGANVPPIWETIAELGRSVPDEEWAKVPSDLSVNLDHYLYGAPKKSE